MSEIYDALSTVLETDKTSSTSEMTPSDPPLTGPLS
jgi:hypothetical protein